MQQVLCFGELLLRLGAPGHEPLLSRPLLEVCYGGAEANVAVALAHLGHATRMVSVVPDNPLGAACLGELRRHGVDTRAVQTGPGRMGLYFYQAGAMQRPAEVLYDRAGSAFALAAADAIDWSGLLPGSRLLHVSGITPALSDAAAAAAVRAMRAAREAGLTVSFDGNFRARLWQARGVDPGPILGQLLAEADLLFGDHRDLQLILKQEFPGADGPTRTRRAAQAAFASYPNLQKLICTTRAHSSVEQQSLGALLCTRETCVELPPIPLDGVIDRVGAGDAFAAGVLHGLLSGADDHLSLQWGQAAAGLKHSLPGDFFTLGPAALAAFLADGGLDVKR